ncbi:MAG: hypothetical protein WBD31_05275 [Rubripirellula sp.]
MLSRLGQIVVDALTWRVRVISFQQLEQLGNLLHTGPVDLEVRRLLGCEYIAQVNYSATALKLESPLATWRSSESDVPDFDQICWRAKSRARGDGCLPNSKIFVAAKRAVTEFGGCGGKLRQPFQITHDLGTTSVFLAKVAFFGWEDCQDWTSEDVLRRHYRHLRIEKVPDAATVSNERIGCAIEFVGRDYSPASLRKFHHHWSRRQISYEVW